MFDLYVQVKAAFAAVILLTVWVWAHKLALNLVRTPSMMLLAA